MSEEVIEIATKAKKKREKPEDFIGETFNNGKLRVIGIHGKQGRAVTFKVTCTECSKDPELFPDGYFIDTKRNLKKGKKPCGCSKQPRWFPFQYLILASRVGKKKGFVVHGFAENFHGKNTKLNLECLKDEYKWVASVHSIINVGTGCPRCGGKLKLTEGEALERCTGICKENNYSVIGFVDGYKNCYSYFEYLCEIHGKQQVRYTNFVNTGSRCKGCVEVGYSPAKQGTVYVYQWVKEEHTFLKIGITNRALTVRIKEQSEVTLYNYRRIWSATFEDGAIPLHIENYVKNSGIEIGVMSKEEFPDGFTETICIEDMDYLENLIVEAFCILNTKNIIRHRDKNEIQRP